MARVDADGKSASQSVKIAGADATGLETNYVDADLSGNQYTTPLSRNLPLSGSAGALNANAVAATDVSRYQTASIQITGTWVGQLEFQGSNDNTTWVGVMAVNASEPSPTPSSIATANGIYFISLQFQYFRVRMIAYTSGTATATGQADSLPAHPSQISSADVLNTGGLDTVLALTTAPALGIVGAQVKAGRKYLVVQGLSANIKWGFSSGSQSFTIAKKQMVLIPVGPLTQVWFKVTTGTGSVAIGEL